MQTIALARFLGLGLNLLYVLGFGHGLKKTRRSLVANQAVSTNIVYRDNRRRNIRSRWTREAASSDYTHICIS